MTEDDAPSRMLGSDGYQDGSDGYQRYQDGGDGYPGGSDGYPGESGDPDPPASADPGTSEWWARLGFSSFEEYLAGLEANQQRYSVVSGRRHRAPLPGRSS